MKNEHKVEQYERVAENTEIREENEEEDDHDDDVIVRNNQQEENTTHTNPIVAPHVEPRENEFDTLPIDEEDKVNNAPNAASEQKKEEKKEQLEVHKEEVKQQNPLESEFIAGNEFENGVNFFDSLRQVKENPQVLPPMQRIASAPAPASASKGKANVVPDDLF